MTTPEATPLSHHAPPDFSELKVAMESYVGPPPLGDMTDEMPIGVYWPGIPPEDSPGRWRELREWVEGLQQRFEFIDHHVVPDCWWRHNQHVEALSALRNHEQASFSEMAPPTAAVDWFRALRDMAAMLKQWNGEGGCGREHENHMHRVMTVDENAWQRHVQADTDRRSAEAVGVAAEAEVGKP